MKYRAEVEAVQWKGTDESWDEIVELYQGVETVAFRTDDGGVETEDGREQSRYLSATGWSKTAWASSAWWPPDEFNVLFVQTPIE
jgi:hypothetical protein